MVARNLKEDLIRFKEFNRWQREQRRVKAKETAIYEKEKAIRDEEEAAAKAIAKEERK